MLEADTTTRPIFQFDPGAFTPESEIHQARKEKLKAARNLAILTTGKTEVTARLSSGGVWHILKIGDIHEGDTAVDHDEVEEIVPYCHESPKRLLVLLGDEYNGVNPEQLGTTMRQLALALEEQIAHFEEGLLKPLAGRILGMPWFYHGHTEWSNKKVMFDNWRVGTRNGIPILIPGGNIVTPFPTGEQLRFKVFHNAGRAPKANPLASALAHGAVYPLNHPFIPDEVCVGNSHYNSCAIVTRSGSIRQAASMCGTYKGSTPELRDRFAMESQAGRIYDQPGANTIIWTKNGQPRLYPCTDLDRGELVFQALTFRDNLPDWLATELQKMINAVEPRPDISINSQFGAASDSPHPEAPPGQQTTDQPSQQATQYEKVVIDAASSRPILFFPFGNTRFGAENSLAFETQNAAEIDFLLAHPHSLVAILRRTLDPDVPSDVSRVFVLDHIINLFSSLAQNRQLVAIMLDKVLRDKKWKRGVGEKDKDGTFESSPIKPGTYLSESLNNTPLMTNNYGRIEVNIHPPDSTVSQKYVIMCMDGTAGSGSTNNPFLSLRRAYDWGAQVDFPDLTIGGLNPNGGFQTFMDRLNLNTPWPTLMSMGWRSKVDSWGKGNVRAGAEAGVGAILLPDRHMLFPTAYFEQTKEIFEALDLYLGAGLLGLVEKTTTSN